MLKNSNGDPFSDHIKSSDKMVARREVLVNSHTGYNFQLPDNLYISDHIGKWTLLGLVCCALF